MKAREWWLNPRPHTAPRAQGVTNRYSAWSNRGSTYSTDLIHVREVLPGQITITREEFRSAWALSIDEEPSEALENKLFSTPSAK